ncbi:MAG: class I SAM-dependent methyltransferase [Terriglobales bacterium]
MKLAWFQKPALSKFHFVDDYRRHVRRLMRKYPLDKAMSMAVGGYYRYLGRLERELLIAVGLRPEHYLIDVGCGSGRLAQELRDYLMGKYLGTDIVPELLEYAARGTPPHWRFRLVDGLDIPEKDAVADMVCFFSVFTHILHEESFYYLREARRVLKPGGRIVFSFLDISQPSHWPIFENMSKAPAKSPHLNMYLGTDMIHAWSQHLGLELEQLQGGDTPWFPLSEPICSDEDGAVQQGLGTLGQSVAVMRMP